MVFGFGKKKEVVQEAVFVANWTNVDSSFVEAVAYDSDKNDLYVTLSHGSYIYHGVPQNIYHNFLDAPSKGTYFNSKVKDIYVFTPR